MTAVFPLEKDERRAMKKERRAMMSVSHFRVIEGLDHSAETAAKRRKPIT